MNIFVLDTNPKLAAQYHCNKHVIKMILESVQLLSTAHHILGNGGPLKKTHANHPCALWVRESTDNYNWLHELTTELCIEYTYRYNKHHVYETNGVLATLKVPPFLLMRGPMTPFAQAMPDTSKHSDPVTAYRQYYLNDKFSMLEYKIRDMPHWVLEHLNNLIYDRQYSTND